MVLEQAHNWQFDSFSLDRASDGHPLSVMAFYLFKKMDITKRFHLNETKLARFLIHIEEGYPNNPYHCRTHAVDVLRLLHVLLNRGGVVRAVAGAAHARSLLSAEERNGISRSSPAPINETSEDVLNEIRSAQDLVSCWLRLHG